MDEDDLGNKCMNSIMACFNKMAESSIINTKPNGIVKRIVEDERFEYFIQFFIILNSIALGSLYYD